MQFEDMFTYYGNPSRKSLGDTLCWYVRKSDTRPLELVMCFPVDLLELLGWRGGDRVKFVIGKQDSEAFMCVVKSDQGLKLCRPGGSSEKSIRYYRVSKIVTAEEAVKLFHCDPNNIGQPVYPKDGWPHVGDDGVLIFASKKLPKIVSDERGNRVPVLRRR